MNAATAEQNTLSLEEIELKISENRSRLAHLEKRLNQNKSQGRPICEIEKMIESIDGSIIYFENLKAGLI